MEIRKPKWRCHPLAKAPPHATAEGRARCARQTESKSGGIYFDNNPVCLLVIEPPPA